MSLAPELVLEQLRKNIERVQSQVNDALDAAHRPVGSVKIVAVSKYVDAQLTWQLIQAGCHALGESRPQSLWEKAAYVASQTNCPVDLEWHMIGHMQRNKAARTMPLMAWLHSLDSLRLAETLSTDAVKQGKRLRTLLEVNATQDASKTGLQVAAATQVLEQVIALPGIEVCGLMSMSTEGASPDQARSEFEAVRLLRDQLQSRFGSACQLSELSLGMSGDFQQGIAAGATMIRVGSVLWDGIL